MQRSTKRALWIAVALLLVAAVIFGTMTSRSSSATSDQAAAVGDARGAAKSVNTPAAPTGKAAIPIGKSDVPIGKLDVPTGKVTVPTREAARPRTVAKAAATEAEPGDVPADNDLTRGIGVGSRPGSMRAIPRAYQLTYADGFALVSLAGGPPTIRSYGGREPGPSRSVSGRVIDRAGQPVAGAIVLVDKTFHIGGGNIMVDAGAITDASGAFTAERAPVGPCVAIALVHGDWSELAEVADAPIELRVVGHGTLRGKLTYNEHGDSFELHVRSRDRRFEVRHESEANGVFDIVSLPPGPYTLSAGLVQSFGAGQSARRDREVTISAGRTTEVEMALSSGTTVVATARPPTGTSPSGLKFWLFSGAAPKTGAEARARTAAEHPPNLAVGGDLVSDQAQFHDVRAGTYAVCAGVFDVVTMDALDSPFGCTSVTLHADDSVRELEIIMKP